MTLADSSVWISHFRKTTPALQALLETRQLLIHPLIIGELACGTLPQRAATLHDLKHLPWAVIGKHWEVLAMVETHRLWDLGIGWVDAHLLVSALLSRCHLWTLDRRLLRVAARLNVVSPRAPELEE